MRKYALAVASVYETVRPTRSGWNHARNVWSHHSIPPIELWLWQSNGENSRTWSLTTRPLWATVRWQRFSVPSWSCHPSNRSWQASRWNRDTWKHWSHDSRIKDSQSGGFLTGNTFSKWTTNKPRTHVLRKEVIPYLNLSVFIGGGRITGIILSGMERKKWFGKMTVSDAHVRVLTELHKFQIYEMYCWELSLFLQIPS